MDVETAQEVIPRLLWFLRFSGKKGACKANWIEDVYSEVIRQIECGDLADTTWIGDLLEICDKQLEKVMEDIEIVVSRKCEACEGSGNKVAGAAVAACQSCKGTGRKTGGISVDELARLVEAATTRRHLAKLVAESEAL